MSSLELIQTLVEAGFPDGTSLSPMDFEWLWQTEACHFLKWFCTLDSRNVLSDSELQELASLDVTLQNGQVDQLSSEAYDSLEEENHKAGESQKSLEVLDQEIERMKLYEETLLRQDAAYCHQMQQLEEESKRTGTALKQVHRDQRMEREKVALYRERLDQLLSSLLGCCEDVRHQEWVCLDGGRQRDHESRLLNSMMAAKAPPHEIKTPTLVENEFEALQNRIQETEGFHLKSNLELESLQKILKFYDALLQHQDLSALLASHRLKLEADQAKTAAHYSAQKVQKVWEKEVQKNFQLHSQVARKRLELAQIKGQNNRLKKALLDWTQMTMDESLTQAARLQLLFLGHNTEQRSLLIVQATMATVASLMEKNQVRTEVAPTLQETAGQLIVKEDHLAQFLVSILGNEDLKTSLYNTYPDLVAAIQQAQLGHKEHKSAFQNGLKCLVSDVTVLESHHQEVQRTAQHDQAANFLADLSSLQQDYNLLQAQIRSLVKDLEKKKKVLSEDKLRELERLLHLQFYTAPNKFKSSMQHLMAQAENERQLLHSFAVN